MNSEQDSSGFFYDVEKPDKGLVAIYRSFLCILFVNCVQHPIGVGGLSEFLRESEVLIANSIVDPSTRFQRFLHVYNIFVRVGRGIGTWWWTLRGGM